MDVPGLRALKNRLLAMVTRGVVAMVRDGEPPEEEEDEKKPVPLQLLQVRLLAGETRGDVERVQEYGFSSVPMPGARPVVVVCPAGDRAQALAIAVDDVRYRPVGGQPGDVVIYDLRGNMIRLRPGDPPEEEDDPPPNAVLEIVAAKDWVVSIAGAAQINVGGDCTLTVGGTLNLGGTGGSKVARIGDTVEVGGIPGTITGGSNKVKAVG